MSLASTATFRGVRPVRRSSARRKSKTPYRPYHAKGEFVWLTIVALAGIAWLALPITFLVKLIGTVFIFLVVPTKLFTVYWPKIHLHNLGWRMPNLPRNPVWYTAVVTTIACLPIVFFLTVQNPISFAAVSPNESWEAWILLQGLLAIMAMAQAAFFTGVILFRLTDLIKPWMAIVLVAMIMTLGQLLLPGTLAVFALPLSFALTWMAWQTHSFVPAALTQLLLVVTYDLLVRLTV